MIAYKIVESFTQSISIIQIHEYNKIHTGGLDINEGGNKIDNLASFIDGLKSENSCKLENKAQTMHTRLSELFKPKIAAAISEGVNHTTVSFSEVWELEDDEVYRNPSEKFSGKHTWWDVLVFLREIVISQGINCELCNPDFLFFCPLCDWPQFALEGTQLADDGAGYCEMSHCSPGSFMKLKGGVTGLKLMWE